MYTNGAWRVYGNSQGDNLGNHIATTQIQSTLGSAAAPGYSLVGDLNTGVFSPGADQLSITTGGTERMRVLANGNVGIGVAAPTAMLEVFGVGFNARLGAGQGWAGNNYPTLSGTSNEQWIMIHNPHIPYLQNGVNGYVGATTGAQVRMAANTGATTYWDAGVLSTLGTDAYGISRGGAAAFVTVNNTGNVGIGSVAPTAGRLQFANTLENKIVVWDGGAADRYGFGLNASNLSAFVPVGARFSLRQNGNAGAEVFEVSGTNGQIQSDALAGVGNRPLAANAAGQIVPLAGVSGTLANLVSGSGNGTNPINDNVIRFLSPTANVTITAGQRVVVTASKALGSFAAGGANALDLWIGYQGAGAIVTVGGGSFGQQCNQNERTLYSLTTHIDGLPAGTYNFGLVGRTTSANWNSNEWGYVTVMVFNP